MKMGAPSNVTTSRRARAVVVADQPMFEYVVETDEDDAGALHASLGEAGFCGVVRRGTEVTLVYGSALSKTKEAAVRKKVKDHRAKRLATPAAPIP